MTAELTGVPGVGGIRPAEILDHAQLLDQGRRAAGALARRGVGEGDAVAVLLPIGLESVVATLACGSLDARRLTLAAGDPVHVLRERLQSSGVRLVITADNCREEDGVVPVKARLDRALRDCPGVRGVLVVPQVAGPVPWSPGRDHWWHEALATEPPVGRPYAEGMSSTTPPPRRQQKPPSLIFDDPLTGPSADDSDEGWGEQPAELGGSAADLRRFLDDKPPHHL